MSRSKLPIIIGILAGITVLNLVLVLTFPSKPAKVVEQSLPDSPLDPQIQITFNEVMNRDSVEENFTIEPAIEGNMSWSGKTFVFTPKENLEYNRNYSITIDETVKSIRGENLKQSYNQNFKTKELSFLAIETNGTAFGSLIQASIDTKEIKKLTDESIKIKAFDYDPQQNSVLIHSIEPESLKILNLSTENLKTIFTPPPETIINHAKWLPYENKVIFSTSTSTDEEKSTLNSIDTQTKEITNIATGENLVYEFYPTPDGRGVIIINEEGALVLINLTSQEKSVLVTNFENFFGLSQYGGYLIYTTLIDQNIFDPTNNLIAQNNNGDKITALESYKALIDKPQMAPSEDRIVFEYTENYNISPPSYQLAELNFDGKKLEILTPDSFNISSPSYSPDGKHIIFIKKENLQIQDSELAGGELTLLTFGEFQMNDTLTELDIKGRDVEWIE